MKLCILCCIFLIVCTFSNNVNGWFTRDERWKGRWFPHAPGSRDLNPFVELTLKSDYVKHKNLMGLRRSDCDDGKTNLTLDWDNSADAYLCFEENTKSYLPNLSTHPILQCDHIPHSFEPMHECMYTPIVYNDDIPTFGNHRPLWARYGEYQYLPPQRWVHNLEHGAIVMLYHPCANSNEVNLLRKTVTSCLFRHIITPYNKLKPERPFALITWGCKLLMSKVDVKIAREFIKTSALQAPEKVHLDGQFDYALLNSAKIVSDERDTKLCPL